MVFSTDSTNNLVRGVDNPVWEYSCNPLFFSRVRNGTGHQRRLSEVGTYLLNVETISGTLVAAQGLDQAPLSKIRAGIRLESGVTRGCSGLLTLTQPQLKYAYYVLRFKQYMLRFKSGNGIW
jgi:hypothetical protein